MIGVGVSTSRVAEFGEGLAEPVPVEIQPTNGMGAERRFRPDIQALRALAVGLVVVGHLWPKSLTGGYIGVDVFFVISGFLITAHLSRELFATGRVNFAAFYSRRIRRLLPAAFLVLGVSLGAAAIILPFSRWKDTAQQILASAAYVENWVLAANAVDYSASTANATVAQHYWSLSVEEQFYLFWPLLLVGVALLARFTKSRPRLVAVAGIAIVSIASLLLSVFFADTGRHEAYFYTPVRLWEFGIGALLSLVAARLKFPRFVAVFSALVGLVVLLVCSVLYNATTPFPGLAALAPALGTALVIAAGTPSYRTWPVRLMSAPPLQFIGGISYSLYLWHWPLIVLGPFVINAELRSPSKLILLVISIGLAWATKVWVEDRGMTFRPKVRPALKTFAAMVIGIGIIAAGGAALSLGQDLKVADAEQFMQAQKASVCYGPSSMDHTAQCADRFGPALAPTMSEANAYFNSPEECGEHLGTLLAGERKTTRVCDFTSGAASAPEVWLIGDSHGQQWQAPIFELAKRNKWLLKISFLGGCPPADVSFVGFYSSVADEGSVSACRDWGRAVSDAIIDEKPAYVFTSTFARRERVDDGSGRSQNDQYAEGFGRYWNSWLSNGTQVVVLSDPPYNIDVRSADCTLLNAADPVRCAVDRSAAAPEDPQIYAARAINHPGLKLVDLTDYFCDATKCYGAVGNVVVYYDANHLNGEFSRLLAPMIESRL